MVLRRKRFIIGGFIVFLAIGYLAYMGFMGSATYYYTVSELVAQGDSVNGENVRVNGQVAVGSVEQEIEERTLKFTIVDISHGESLPVIYQGIVPDTFRVGNEVVLEGHLNSIGEFEAHTLMPKCASKYVSKG